MNMRLSVVVLCAFYLLETVSAAANAANRRPNVSRANSRLNQEPVVAVEANTEVPTPAAGAGLLSPFSTMTSMVSDGLGAVGGHVSTIGNGVGSLVGAPVSKIGNGIGSLVGGATNTIDSIGSATGLGTPASFLGAAGTSAFMNYGPGALIKQNFIIMAAEMIETFKQVLRDIIQNLIARIPTQTLELILNVISQTRAFLEMTFRRMTGIGNGINMSIR